MFHSNQADTWWDRPVLPAFNEVRFVIKRKTYTNSFYRSFDKFALIECFIYRVPFIREGIRSSGIIKRSMAESRGSLHDVSILDVGCGGGILSEVCEIFFKNVFRCIVAVIVIMYSH